MSRKKHATIERAVPVVIDGKVAHAALADFLKAVENLSADESLGAVVQRAVNRGRRKRPEQSGITSGKLMLADYKSLTSKTIKVYEGDPGALDPKERGMSERAGLWRALGRTKPFGVDEACEVVGVLYGVSGEAVKKIISKLR